MSAMPSNLILKLRQVQVRLGDLPDESIEIAGGLTNGNLLTRLRDMTPDSAGLDELAENDADQESAESDV